MYAPIHLISLQNEYMSNPHNQYTLQSLCCENKPICSAIKRSSVHTKHYQLAPRLTLSVHVYPDNECPVHLVKLIILHLNN